MKRKIITTADGSKTIQIEDWNEQYHSKHGALQEANHVFINNGLLYYLTKTNKKSLSILEIGFGTGLNALLTVLNIKHIDVKVNYVGVEAYPVLNHELAQLNYTEVLPKQSKTLFSKLHEAKWEVKTSVTSNFLITKRKQFFKDIIDKQCFDLIYFDAFGARVQPELWTKAVFEIMYNALKANGVLVTYAAIGQVKRDMKSLGFKVERLQGPPGKRHMLRATKL